jgi:hypothetical protein
VTPRPTSTATPDVGTLPPEPPGAGPWIGWIREECDCTNFRTGPSLVWPSYGHLPFDSAVMVWTCADYGEDWWWCQIRNPRFPSREDTYIRIDMLEF